MGFLTVRPGAQFVVVLEGPMDWTELAGELLREALAERGVGGKATSGYGRARLSERRLPTPPPSAVVAEFAKWLEAAPGVLRDRLQQTRVNWLERLRQLSDHDRREAAKILRRQFKRGKVGDQVDAMCAELTPATS